MQLWHSNLPLQLLHLSRCSHGHCDTATLALQVLHPWHCNLTVDPCSHLQYIRQARARLESLFLEAQSCVDKLSSSCWLTGDARIHTLNLSSNRIKDRGAAALAEMLKVRLSALVMSGTMPCAFSTTMTLISACSSHRSMRRLVLMLVLVLRAPCSCTHCQLRCCSSSRL